MSNNLDHFKKNTTAENITLQNHSTRKYIWSHDGMTHNKNCYI
jgi:hypothetical protein